MNASRMMARMTMTTQKKNTMIPGMAYPATVLALATAVSYPPPTALFERAEQSSADDGGMLARQAASRSLREREKGFLPGAGSV
jgi:hypothetical protein